MSMSSPTLPNTANLVERMPVAAFAAKKGQKYCDVFGLHPKFKKLAFKSNLILVGPKGIGKSLSIATFAADVEDCPLVTFDCSEDVRRSTLLGTFILRGDQTPFILGPLTTAFEIANEVGKCILVLEEINALTPQMQKCLNAATDFRRKIEVPEAKQVFQLKEGAQLWITGTMNTAVYGGVYQLNEDLKSRMRLVPLDYCEPKKEKEIVLAVLNGLHGKLPGKTLDSVILLAHETRQKALDYALSTRDVLQILEDILLVGVEDALWIATGKFEGDDRAAVKERIQSIFGVQIP